MKTIALAFMALFVCLSTLKSQDNTFVISMTDENGFRNPPATLADFSQPIIIQFPGTPPTGYVVSVLNGHATVSERQADNSYIINVRDNAPGRITVRLEATGIVASNFPLDNTRDDRGNVSTGTYDNAYTFFYNSFPAFKDVNARYDRKGNKAYFFFDENGILQGPAPVNIDADDYLIIYMAVPKVQRAAYSIQVEGEYNPSDLLFRPSETIQEGGAQGEGDEEIEYTYITSTFGPFTSEIALIQFFLEGKELPNNFKVRINPLYHVALGASFISTQLGKPDFDIAPVPGTSDFTIREINSGNRTLATFNIIFYWKPALDWISGRLQGKSNITRGRDILKEATFWERINPTFGVAIKNDWRENFFFGGSFEFARGGSISGGWHYGKIQELADPDFELGVDTFNGSKDDILLSDRWDSGFFIGITLDTRVFNRVLGRGL